MLEWQPATDSPLPRNTMSNAPNYRELWEEYWFHYGPSSAATQELQTNSDSQAAEFAKLLIQLLVLLHGGALVALPTFFQVFELTMHDHRIGFWTVFIVIALGLIGLCLRGCPASSLCPIELLVT